MRVTTDDAFHGGPNKSRPLGIDQSGPHFSCQTPEHCWQVRFVKFRLDFFQPLLSISFCSPPQTNLPSQKYAMMVAGARCAPVRRAPSSSKGITCARRAPPSFRQRLACTSSSSSSSSSSSLKSPSSSSSEEDFNSDDDEKNVAIIGCQ